MAGVYQSFTSARATDPDPAQLLAQLRALDATAGVQHQLGTPDYIIKKATAWAPAHITAAQSVIDTAPAASAQRAAQSTINSWPLDLKASHILIMEQMNVVRAALTTLGVPNLPPFTEQQFIDAIKAKAGTL